MNPIRLNAENVENLEKMISQLATSPELSEFAPSTDEPLQVWPSTGRPGLVYSTKPRLLLPYLSSATRPLLALCGPAPDREAARFLGMSSQLNGGKFCFVGDLDPCDLAHACLVASFAQDFSVYWAGIDDWWLDTCRRNWSTTEFEFSRLEIPQNEAEQKLWPLVRLVWPEIETILGASAFELLSRGMKLELEALTVPPLYNMKKDVELRRHLSRLTSAAGLE